MLCELQPPQLLIRLLFFCFLPRGWEILTTLLKLHLAIKKSHMVATALWRLQRVSSRGIKRNQQDVKASEWFFGNMMNTNTSENFTRVWTASNADTDFCCILKVLKKKKKTFIDVLAQTETNLLYFFYFETQSGHFLFIFFRAKKNNNLIFQRLSFYLRLLS